MIGELTFPSTQYWYKLPSAREMAAFDAATIADGTPSLTLMERAGSKIFDTVVSLSFQYKTTKPSAVILCGPGNNGGDGLVLARLLSKQGWTVRVFCASASRYSNDFIEQARSFVRSGGQIVPFPERVTEHDCIAAAPAPRALVETALRESSVAIDALLGTGQCEAPRGSIKELIEILNCVTPSLSKIPLLISVDVPSGVSAESGEAFVPHVKATHTVCIELLKRGMIQYPARECCGEVQVVSIGIDCSAECEFSVITSRNVPALKARRSDAHKGHFGHVAVIGGSRNLPGAPVLSSVAALRAGAGTVTKAQFAGMPHVAHPAEVMLETVESEGSLGRLALKGLKELMNRASCALIGPGIGRDEDTGKLICALIEHASDKNVPLVIDADALTLLGEARRRGAQFNLSHCVLTPHPGEAARLLGCESADVQRDRYSAVKTLAKDFGTVVVLKGAATIVYGGGRGRVNTSGNPFMATAGSGDVLGGVIAALVGQGHSLLDAATLGVFVHGRAGELAHGVHRGPILAGDICAQIPFALGEVGYGGTAYF